MPLAYFVIFFGCTTVPVISGYSSFYYSFPQPTTYSEPGPFSAFTHHPSPFFPTLFNSLPTYNPQPFIYSSQNFVGSNLPNEDKKSFGTTTYHGFVYGTHLGSEATSNVFFLAGSDAHKKGQIKKFIMSARNNMDHQLNSKTDVTYEKIRPVSDIIKEVFGNQPIGFQYIYSSNVLPGAPKGRSLSEDIPRSQPFNDKNAKPNTTSTTEPDGNRKESTTEKDFQTEKPETTSTTAESSRK